MARWLECATGLNKVERQRETLGKPAEREAAVGTVSWRITEPQNLNWIRKDIQTGTEGGVEIKAMKRKDTAAE